jgi:hypothetical protein
MVVIVRTSRHNVKEEHGMPIHTRGGRHSTFLEIAPPGFKTPSYACSITPEWTGSVSDVIF